MRLSVRRSVKTLGAIMLLAATLPVIGSRAAGPAAAPPSRVGAPATAGPGGLVPPPPPPIPTGGLPLPASVPTATPTATPASVKPYVLRIKYAYLWYRKVRMGTWNYIVLQANHPQRLPVTFSVVYPAGQVVTIRARTNKQGRWEHRFDVPRGTSTAESNQALVIVLLHHGLTTKRSDLPFELAPAR